MRIYNLTQSFVDTNTKYHEGGLLQLATGQEGYGHHLRLAGGYEHPPGGRQWKLYALPARVETGRPQLQDTGTA